MYDDGNKTDVDDIAGDNVYSVKAVVNSASPADLKFYAIIFDSNGTELGRSNEIQINAYKPLDTQAVTTQANAVSANLGSILNQTNEEKLQNYDATVNSLKEELNKLEQNDTISDYSIDGNNITINLKSGVTMVDQIIDTEKTDAGDKENEGGGAAGALENYDFNANLDNDSVSLEALKSWGNYKVIIWHGHGGNSSQIGSYLLTGEKATNQSILSNSSDLQSLNLVMTMDQKYCVTPGFFKKYYTDNSLEDSIIYLAACESGKDTRLADSLLDAEADTVIANTESIYTVYNCTMEESFFTYLSTGLTAKEALINAKKDNGEDDRSQLQAMYPGYYSGTPAKPYILGDENYKLDLSKKTCANLSFEYDFDQWITSGDTRGLTALQDVKPTEGNKMAVVGTGLGDMLSKDNYIKTNLTIPEGCKTLKLDYDFISEELPEYKDSKYNDHLQIWLKGNSSDEPIMIVEETVNESEWTPLGGNYFADGDETTYHTGQKTASYDISGLGNEITLTILVWDEGDSIYDSAVAIDNIRLN